MVCVQEKASKRSCEASAGVPGLSSVRLGVALETVKRFTFDAVKREGFTRMPSQGLSSFKPNCKDTDTVFITIVYFDIESVQHIIADNLAHAKSHKVIITSSGSIVDAQSLNMDSWLDRTGKNHKAKPCTTCASFRSLCTVCLVESRMEKIQMSIGVVSSCRVAQTLISVLENIANDKVAKKEEEVRQIMSQVEELAKHYWTLEAKTKRSVREIKGYGENLQEAAEDFLEDGIISDFWKEISNMSGVKEALEKANEEHEIIQGQVKRIGEQRPKKSELSGWQLSMRKNSPDEMRKSFLRPKKPVNCFHDIRVCVNVFATKKCALIVLGQKSVGKSFSSLTRNFQTIRKLS